jgi:hypothetical protein
VITAVQHAHVRITTNQSQQKNNMGILDNFESAWDEEFVFESKPMPITDNMGREVFWEDMGRPESLATKIFSETICDNCSTKTS